MDLECTSHTYNSDTAYDCFPWWYSVYMIKINIIGTQSPKGNE